MSTQTDAGLPRPDNGRDLVEQDRMRFRGDLQLGRRNFAAVLGLAAVTALAAPRFARAVQTATLPKGAVTIVAFVRARHDKRAELFDATAILVKEVRQEAGNILCQIHRGVEEPDLLVFYEIFESEEALQYHLSAPHVKKWVSDVQELIVGGVELKLLEALT